MLILGNHNIVMRHFNNLSIAPTLLSLEVNNILLSHAIFFSTFRENLIELRN